MKYRDENGEDQYSTRRYDFVRTSQLANWGFSCINVWTKISEEFELEAPFVEMNSIEIERLENSEEDVYVDNVWIGKNDLTGKAGREGRGLQPQHFICITDNFTLYNWFQLNTKRSFLSVLSAPAKGLQ